MQGETSFIEREGVRLAYEERGEGGPAILLVHGMQCDRGQMRPLLDRLARGHRVVAIDLRGHGDSDRPRAEYDNPTFTADLRAIIAQLGLHGAIGIGHSFGGTSLVRLAVEHPGLLGGLVLLDTGIRSAADKAAELKSHYDLGSPAALAAFFSDRLFGRDDAAEVRDAVIDRMLAVPDYVVESMQRSVLSFDTDEAAHRIACPALLIMADRPFVDAGTLAGLPDNWRVAQVVGAGHFVQLFALDQVEAMVRRFVELVPKPAPVADPNMLAHDMAFGGNDDPVGIDAQADATMTTALLD